MWLHSGGFSPFTDSSRLCVAASTAVNTYVICDECRLASDNGMRTLITIGTSDRPCLVEASDRYYTTHRVYHITKFVMQMNCGRANYRPCNGLEITDMAMD